MIAFGDKRWRKLKGGYRTAYDPRPVLKRLESGVGIEACWDELWEELHHQDDVDQASYAAIPHLVRIAPLLSPTDWNPFALVGTIALRAGKKPNPPIPVGMRPVAPKGDSRPGKTGAPAPRVSEER